MQTTYFVSGILAGIFLYWQYRKIKIRQAIEKAEKIKGTANEKGERIIDRILSNYLHHFQEMKRNIYEFLQKYQKNLVERDEKLEKFNSHLFAWEDRLKKIQKEIDKYNKNLKKVKKENKILEDKLKILQDNIYNTLLKKSSTGKAQIKESILKELEENIKREITIYYNHRIEKTNQNYQNLAIRLLSGVIQRCQFNHWTDTYSNVVFIENNIEEYLLEKFEEKLDVELIFDYDNSLINIISGDSVKREVARHIIKEIDTYNFNKPNDIEEFINKINKKVDLEILQNGEKICDTSSIKLAPELQKLLGRLKYRTSFGQNVLNHCLEVANIAKILAYELGLDGRIANRSGLLHDIGKSLDHEHEGGHPEIGADFLQDFNEHEEVIEAVRNHHGDFTGEVSYGLIINTSDAISASRPGARRETFERYIQRLEKLETIASSLPGIENVFAISAGRELRVVVDPEKVSDDEAENLAKKISNMIQEELRYPGRIKITLIRDIRIIEYAK